MCVYTFVDACVHLSLGGDVPLLAYLRVCGYLCPPVSKPRVFPCVLVCTWISMCVSTCRAAYLWGCTLEEQRLTLEPAPRAQHLRWGRRGREGWENPRPSSSEGLGVG